MLLLSTVWALEPGMCLMSISAVYQANEPRVSHCKMDITLRVPIS